MSEFQSRIQDSKSIPARNVVQLHRPVPSYEHIRLKSTGIKEYIKFFIAWQKYEKENGIKLSISEIVSDDLLDHLLDNSEMSEAKFLNLDIVNFFSLMALD